MKISLNNVIILAGIFFVGIFCFCRCDMYYFCNYLINSSFSLFVFVLVFLFKIQQNQSERLKNKNKLFISSLTDLIITGILSLCILNFIDSINVTILYINHYDNYRLKYDNSRFVCELENLVYQNYNNFIAIHWLICAIIIFLSLLSYLIYRSK